jgi:hypothetical protein
MNPARHTELEIKFAADDVGRLFFRKIMMEANPTSFEHFSHDDTFWQAGEQVVRHRVREGVRNELTSKTRRSADSTTARTEINLNFDDYTTVEDVESFLTATGYKRLFTLRKDYVDVFDFERADCDVEVVFYSVGRTDRSGGKRDFIEVEVHPHEHTILNVAALDVLDYWSRWIQKSLNVSAPLNLSLFEHFSAQTLYSTNFKI